MEIGLLLVSENKTTLKCHIMPIHKIERIAHQYMRPFDKLLYSAYEAWMKHVDKLQSYIDQTKDFKSDDLTTVREINSKFNSLQKNHNLYWPDYDYREYKTLCLQWVSEVKTAMKRLVGILEKHLRSSSGPLSKRDPYYSSLPDLLTLKKTIGSLELVHGILDRHLPLVLARVSLGYSEDKPYRQTNAKIRKLLGVDDKMSGSRIETGNMESLVERISGINKN